MTSVATSADEKFQAICDTLMERLAIERYDFVKVAKEHSVLEEQSAKLVVQSKNNGGKPLAKHWDAMWAEIATQLWNGDLEPKRQSDIKKAMFDWLNSNGIDAGDTVVTERARALWQRIQADG